MKCPVCVTPDLLMTERQGVEIDYCPNCRGVWLDRGELDKIIERGSDMDDDDHVRYPRTEERPYAEDKTKRGEYSGDQRYPPKKRRKSFLDDMFDIFG